MISFAMILNKYYICKSFFEKPDKIKLHHKP